MAYRVGGLQMDPFSGYVHVNWAASTPIWFEHCATEMRPFPVLVGHTESKGEGGGVGGKVIDLVENKAFSGHRKHVQNGYVDPPPEGIKGSDSHSVPFQMDVLKEQVSCRLWLCRQSTTR